MTHPTPFVPPPPVEASADRAPGPVLVASDVHLGAGDGVQARAFHAWLDHAAERSRHLVLNGDLFDFWFEYRSVIPRGYTRTLGKLAELVDGGVRIDFVGGNHDWWAGSYLSEEVGLVVHHDPIRLSLAGREALVAHGDGLGRGDLGYRLLRLVLRGRPTRWAFRWLHPDVGAAVARRVSRTEVPEAELRAPQLERHRERSAALERWAREALLADDALEMVLLGHTHLPRKVEMAPGRYYLNSGDWLGHCTWVEIDPQAPPRLMAWNQGRPARLSASGGTSAASRQEG